jgi:GT2 family glycosyltransferase|tara:strand:- start:10719 stop:11738 length:1020 start_codon:yes stop_codon:yes gene_type:complete
LNKLSIVILNYNGRDFLEKFLPTVIECSGNHEIVVADNQSTDGSVAFLNEHFPQIRFIQNISNGGFAKGYNDALKQVESEFYILLNSDIEVTPHWIDPLLDIMNDESVAGCQPKVLAYHDKSRFEHAGASGGFLDRDYFPFCRGRILEKTEQDSGQYNDKTEVFWATGAALMIRSKLYHEVGGLDEDFFAHMEEIDLCWRLKKQNYKFMVEPKSVVYHVGGGTLPYSSPFKTYLNFRNSLFMLIKNHEGPLFPKLFFRLILDGIAALRFLLRGEGKQFKSIFNAHVHTYKIYRKMLKKRKIVKENSTTFNRYGLYRGSILWQRYVKKNDQFSKLPKGKF